MTQRALRNLASVALAAIAVFSLAPAASGAVATKLPVGATAALDSVPPKDWALQQTAPILEQVLAKTTLAELGGTALAGDVRAQTLVGYDLYFGAQDALPGRGLRRVVAVTRRASNAQSWRAK